MTILIKNGRVINPATGTDETLDVLVENGVVTRTCLLYTSPSPRDCS